MALRWPDAGAAVLVVPAACSGLWSPLLTSGLLEQVLTAEVEEDKPRVCSGSQVERSAACRLTCRCRCMRARDPLAPFQRCWASPMRHACVTAPGDVGPLCQSLCLEFAGGFFVMHVMEIADT